MAVTTLPAITAELLAEGMPGGTGPSAAYASERRSSTNVGAAAARASVTASASALVAGSMFTVTRSSGRMNWSARWASASSAWVPWGSRTA